LFTHKTEKKGLTDPQQTMENVQFEKTKMQEHRETEMKEQVDITTFFISENNLRN
jgi:hypothetical protein